MQSLTVNAFRGTLTLKCQEVESQKRYIGGINGSWNATGKHHTSSPDSSSSSSPLNADTTKSTASSECASKAKTTLVPSVLTGSKPAQVPAIRSEKRLNVASANVNSRLVPSTGVGNNGSGSVSSKSSDAAPAPQTSDHEMLSHDSGSSRFPSPSAISQNVHSHTEANHLPPAHPYVYSGPQSVYEYQTPGSWNAYYGAYYYSRAAYSSPYHYPSAYDTQAGTHSASSSLYDTTMSGFGAPTGVYDTTMSGFGAPSGGDDTTMSDYGAPTGVDDTTMSGYGAPSGGLHNGRSSPANDEPLFQKPTKTKSQRRNAKRKAKKAAKANSTLQQSGFEATAQSMPYSSYAFGQTEFPWLRAPVSSAHTPWTFPGASSTTAISSKKRKLSSDNSQTAQPAKKVRVCQLFCARLVIFLGYHRRDISTLDLTVSTANLCV